jgi:hypothetical protein
MPTLGGKVQHASVFEVAFSLHSFASHPRSLGISGSSGVGIAIARVKKAVAA